MTPVDASEQRNEFCARLKRERERHGVSLAAIAETTKVKSSLLAALERGDLSRWPKGIYRRSFFRDYAATAGLPVDDYTSEFLLLFADRDDAARGDSTANKSANLLALTLGPGAPVDPNASSPGNAFRLTFGEPSRARRGGLAAGPSLPVRSLLALADVAAVLLVSFAGAWLLSRSMWQVSSVIALLGLAVTAIAGRSPSVYLFARFAPSLPLTTAPHTVEETLPAAAAPAREQTRSVRPKRSLPALVVRALRQHAVLSAYLDRLSDNASMTARSQRRRDLIGVRRRRVETANTSAVDEAGII
jgi:transcriptional regulator with XRE-family HTH domain